MRFTGPGIFGSMLFVGSIAAGGLTYTSAIKALNSGRIPSHLTTEPFVYVIFATAAAVGFAMMLSGRQLDAVD